MRSLAVWGLRSDQDYREKAANTAQAVRSAVETAQLVVRGTGEGKAPGRYVGRALADVESDVSSVSTAFSSIQPPSSAVDQLRSDLTSLLDECSSVLAQLRIVARRGELSQLSGWAEPLPDLAARLARFQAVTGT